MNELEVITNDKNASVTEQITRGEIDAQVATAKRYPRNVAKSANAMMTFATMNEEVAESCFYALPRGGKTIKGPSIRLAEIALATYQNIRAGSRVVDVDRANGAVTVQGVAHDLENNNAVTFEKRRQIQRKRGSNTYDEDMITLASNAGGSIALRDALFKVIPGAVWKPVYEACVKIAIGDAKTFSSKRDRIVDKLKTMGVKEANIPLVCGKQKISELVLDDLETLIGLGTAMKEGEITVENAFPDPKVETKISLGEKPKAEEKPAAETTPATKEATDEKSE